MLRPPRAVTKKAADRTWTKQAVADDIVQLVPANGNGRQKRGDTIAETAVFIPESNRRRTYYLETPNQYDIEALPEGETQEIINLHKVNDVRYLNKFFKAINRKLVEGGIYVGCVETSEQVKQRILNAYPGWIAWPFYVVLFIAKRVLPKLPLTKKIYFAITKGHNRALPKAEVLGRLVCCGFDLVAYQEAGDELYFIVKKIGSPATDPNPSYGPIFKMQRIGKEGKIVNFYKLRTMHPYSEYLQSYIYNHNNLQENGKFKDDFRITTWGSILRKTWMDELPMVINLLKGDVKLVGVRPISEQYASLYPKELLDRRMQYKPGLIPPFYKDMPKGFDEILDSEIKYLEHYRHHPFKTDMSYLLGAAYNICIKQARSQ